MNVFLVISKGDNQSNYQDFWSLFSKLKKVYLIKKRLRKVYQDGVWNNYANYQVLILLCFSPLQQIRNLEWGIQILFIGRTN